MTRRKFPKHPPMISMVAEVPKLLRKPRWVGHDMEWWLIMSYISAHEGAYIATRDRHNMARIYLTYVEDEP